MRAFEKMITFWDHLCLEEDVLVNLFQERKELEAKMARVKMSISNSTDSPTSQCFEKLDDCLKKLPLNFMALPWDKTKASLHQKNTKVGHGKRLLWPWRVTLSYENILLQDAPPKEDSEFLNRITSIEFLKILNFNFLENFQFKFLTPRSCNDL